MAFSCSWNSSIQYSESTAGSSSTTTGRSVEHAMISRETTVEGYSLGAGTSQLHGQKWWCTLRDVVTCWLYSYCPCSLVLCLQSAVRFKFLPATSIGTGWSFCHWVYSVSALARSYQVLDLVLALCWTTFSSSGSGVFSAPSGFCRTWHTCRLQSIELSCPLSLLLLPQFPGCHSAFFCQSVVLPYWISTELNLVVQPGPIFSDVTRDLHQKPSLCPEVKNKLFTLKKWLCSDE